jgi:CHASE2 domain-containing sensor protein/nitrogen-specific signal transduction histidine kinase
MQIRFKQFLKSWAGLFLTISGITGLILGLRLAGYLQAQEWRALDSFFQLRPQEAIDERIVIVGLEESDIQRYEAYQQIVSDEILTKVLTKIQSYQPRIIGLDILRDKPVSQGYDQLSQVFRSTVNLIGVEKIIGEKIQPNPILKALGRSSANDVIIDGDGVLRRGILYPLVPEDKSLPSLGLAVALSYLEKEGITGSASAEGWLQLGTIKFRPFEANDGGYQDADAGSYQTLINFRNSKFTRVSFTDILDNKVNPKLLRDRIVLVGYTAISKKDYFYTPYSKRDSITTPSRTYGIEIHAHLASQILSAVLDNRPLIQVWSDPGEDLWIALWIALPAIGAWRFRSLPNSGQFLLIIVAETAILAALLISIAYFAFQKGWWIPLVPPLWGLGLSALVIAGYIYTEKLMSYQRHLEAMVAERTQQLEVKNQQLQATQEQLITEKKLATLGSVILGVAHEIKNPINLINNFADLSLDLEQEIQAILERQAEQLDPEEFVNLNETILQIFNHLLIIKQQTKRTDRILKKLLQQAPLRSDRYTPTDLNRLVDEAYKLVYYGQRPEGCEMSLETHYDESIGEISLIESDINQVLLNLIENAYYSLSQKQQRLSDNFVPKIILTTKNLGSAVAIEIQDNGEGIATELQEKVFDAFETTKPPGEGTGLGLSIAKDIIEGKHGGKLTLETVAGEYAKLIIVLPVNSGDYDR